ncbi:MAG: type II toxin-antitoxin system prevent-host-death family antitoxin [Micrococcales bacterium]|nr:type II toxin-antitoxin system prevent-host-death family antitoxin [Micrococcales bacterium]
MRTVNTHEAKTHLSTLLAQVEAGEEIVLARRGHPVARLVPLDGRDRPKRELGMMSGRGWTYPDDPSWASSEVADLFEGLS